MSDALGKINVMIVDDDPAIRDSLQMILVPTFKVFVAESTTEAYTIIDQNPIDVILLDIEFPNNESGLDAIENFHNLDEYVQVIMVSGYVYKHYIFEAGRKGAFDFIAKPFDIDHIMKTIKKAAEFKALRKGQERNKKHNIVLFDKDPNFYISAKLILKDEFHLFCCSNLELSKGIINKEMVDVLIFDYKEVHLEFESFLKEVRQHNPAIRLVATVSSPRELWALQGMADIGVLAKNASALEILNTITDAAEGRMDRVTSSKMA